METHRAQPCPVAKEDHMASVTLPASAAARTSRMQREVLVITERLLREYGPQYSSATVLACIADCDAMLRAAGVRNGLSIALESMVAARLKGMVAARLHEPVTIQLPEPLTDQRAEVAAAN
jgi:hypothetical protein